MAVAWKVLTCDYTVSLDSKTNVITCVHWEATDSETVSSVVHSGRIYGSVVIDTSDLSSFIAYDNVTEANALAWAKAALGADEVTKIETSVASQITKSKTPVTGTGVPWS